MWHNDAISTGAGQIVVDQAALYGSLRTVRDLGMPLLSVKRVECGQADVIDIEQSGDDPSSEREDRREVQNMA
jgi:hypothetical protein